MFICTAITPSVAVDNVKNSTNYEIPLSPFIDRRTIEKSIEDNSHIPTNQKRLNNIILKDQPFEKIIQEKNYKNVNDLDENCWIFYPTNDTFIEKNSPDENYGSLNYLNVGTSYSGNYDYDSLLKFNISSITSDKKVFAKLYLYYYGYIERDYEVDYSIYRVTSDWDEDNVTWNKQPSYVSIPTDTLIVPWDAGVWLEFEVTEDVRNFIDGNYINYGWIISDDDYIYQYTTLRGIRFFSKENGNFIPYLVVKEHETFYVDDDNTEGPWNGTKEYPFQKIQDAIDDCFFGDTVYVYNGTYRESVIIYENNINLIGESKKDTIIISEKEKWVVLVRTRYYGVTISGFTISTDINNDKGLAGIVLDFESYDNYVTDNIIVNNSAGILLWSYNNYNYILNNTISCYNYIGTLSDNHGIYLRLHCNHNIISNNTIKDIDIGMYIEAQPEYNDITCNKISNTETGIYLSYIFSYNNISYNLLEDNYYGIYARAIKSNNSISRNTIIKNKYGILVRGFYYSYIFGNVIDSNFCGLFIGEEPGHKLEGLHIYNNNFINNLRHAKFIIDFYPGSIITWTWNENYWDNLRGSSHMILGRTGFFFFQIIPWIMFDKHPAKEPYDIGV